MADDPKSTKPDQGDGSANAPTPGIPNPNPTLPDASIEPAAQVAAAEAKSLDSKETPKTVAPPIPADYQMPDDYANDDPIAKVKAWAEAHPGLAVTAAASIGLVAGRLVMALFPDPEPPSLAERVEKRAKGLQKEAKKKGKTLRAEASAFGGDAGETLQEALHRASEALRDAAQNAGDYAEEGYEKTKDLAETIADALAAKVDDWVKN